MCSISVVWWEGKERKNNGGRGNFSQTLVVTIATGMPTTLAVWAAMGSEYWTRAWKVSEMKEYRVIHVVKAMSREHSFYSNNLP